jgi:hypothetical protein
MYQKIYDPYLNRRYQQATILVQSSTSHVILESELRDLDSVCNATRRKYQRIGSHIYHSFYLNLNNAIRIRVMRLKYAHLKSQIQNTDLKNNIFWPIYRKLKKKQTFISPLTLPSREVVSSNRHKTTLLIDYFSIVHEHAYLLKYSIRIKANKTLEVFYRAGHINSFSQDFQSSFFCFLYACPAACDNDDTISKLLKYVSRNAFIQLYYIFMATLHTSYFPPTWMVATGVLIPKPGKPESVASNYRPINLLLISVKLFEIVLLKLIQKHIKDNSILINHTTAYLLIIQLHTQLHVS